MTYFSLTCRSFEIFLPASDSPQPPSFQSQLCIDQFAMVLDQPINAVVRATAFFVRCERHDDIAVGLEALSPVTR